MYGYDSPEMKPKKDLINRDIEINKANLAKKRLEELVLNKVVWVKFDKNEKYGRTMGVIYNDSNTFIDDYNKSINQQMINENHGKIYFGGSKL